MAPKWSPLGALQRFRYYVGTPREIGAAIQIAVFLYRLPALLARSDLQTFVASQRARHGVFASQERINRIMSFWLRIPALRNRNTCYSRALTLYRFLDAPGTLRVHLGIERRRDLRERLRGHAWVTLDGVLLDPPDAVRDGRIREIPLNLSPAIA